MHGWIHFTGKFYHNGWTVYGQRQDEAAKRGELVLLAGTHS